MTFSYDCERPSKDRIILRLRGIVAKDDIAALHEEVAAIRTEHEGPLDVLFDFTAVERCEVPTRHALLEIQKILRTGPGRTAYVSDRPQIRGIALWVIHQADDGRAKVIGLVIQAEKWFAQKTERLPEATSKGSKLAQHLASVRRLVR